MLLQVTLEGLGLDTCKRLSHGVKMHHPNSPLTDARSADQNQQNSQPKTFQNHL